MRSRRSLLCVAAALTMTIACSQNAAPPPEAAGAGLPPLPADIANAVRPTAVVRAAYQFAAEHPEVLNYIPCFCGCERGGHKANHDCFVKRRDAAGRVVEWDDHGVGCEVCVDVGTLAMQMHHAGASVAEIRTAVEARFASADMGHTPTPAPAKTDGD
jgi:hypothetical protein